MGDIQFEHFKRTLTDAVNDVDFVRKNTLAQDTTWQTQVEERITALTQDHNVKESWSVQSSTGLLISDATNRRLTFDPKGFVVALSQYREGTVQTPGHLWLRSINPTDNIRYLLSDNDKGVLMLGEELEVIRLFPGFGTNTASNEYDEVSAAITVDIGGTEYVIIAMEGHHVVHIYEYDTGNFVSRIGTVDTQGIPSSGDELDTPVALAYNSVDEELWIACQLGQPPSATASRGYVCVWDVSTPATPSWLSTPYYYKTDGSLLRKEVDAPTGLYFDETLDALWISNGTNEIGALDDASGNPVKFLEGTTLNYTLNQPNGIHIRDLGAGTRWLYVANGAYGTVEVFDIQSMRHLKSYGFRSTEDTLVSQGQFVYGSIGQTSGILPDTITIDGVDVDIIVVSDDLNGRVQRINESAYDTENFVVYEPREFGVPIRLIGWSITGDVPLDQCFVYYKASVTDSWHLLDSRTNVPYSSWFQFKLEVKLSTGKIVRPWYVQELVVIGEQT